MKRLSSVAVVVLAVGLLSPAADAGEAVRSSSLVGAVPVNCGDTITVDTTLVSDLRNCRNNGLVIGADGVTVDLNGHRIDGNGTPFAGCGDGDFCDVGVLNDGHDGVTVKGGLVRQFALGVFVGRASHNRVQGIRSVSNEFVGIGVVQSARSVVRNSSGSRNGGADGDGMFLLASHHIRVVHNSFRHNGELGLHVGDANRNVIRNNRFARHTGIALLMEGDANQVRRNHIRRNNGNIIVIGNRNVIVANRVSRSARSPHPGPGIAVEDGRGNLVARNLIADLRGPGISLGLANPPVGGSHNVVRRNVVRDSGRDGFFVARKDDHSLLKRNVAVGAADDGFDVKGAATTLTGNRAVRNGDLGIQAARRVIDGGGNIARHNADARQCTHISCR